MKIQPVTTRPFRPERPADGCITLNEDDNVRGSADQSFVPGADIPGRWWTLFRSNKLNRHVEEALANNPTLEMAQASLRIVQQNVLAQRRTLFPTLTANPQALRAQAPGLELQSPLQDQNQYLWLCRASRMERCAPSGWPAARLLHQID